MLYEYYISFKRIFPNMHIFSSVLDTVTALFLHLPLYILLNKC